MQNKFFFNGVKCFLFTGIIVIVVSFSYIFSGCSGSEEEQVDQRTLDSIEVYTGLQKAFGVYKKALSYNETGDPKAAESFELSLTYLNEINTSLINKPGSYFWKQDYEDLARSIVQDYLTTQSEIKQNSLVFDYAGRFSVTYEKIEEVRGDREPLPDGSEIPLIRNSVVDEYIEFFSNTERGRSFIDKCLYRSGKYFPIMRKILKSNNAPEELIYLSVQESGLSPTIVSRAGAVGLWQFMPSTGFAYGLGQDEYRDDRRDFEKATDAAARHLKDLYKTFDDWYLAFCAYNAGPGRVNSAIRKSGSHDFWSLRGYLPGETRNYVPSILALSFVLRNPEEYGFQDVEYGNPVSYDRVNVSSSMTLQNVADFCQTDIETIRDLNPELTNDIVPSYEVMYQLRIPEGSFKTFSENYQKSGDIDRTFSPPEFAGNEIGGYASSIQLKGYKVINYEPDDIRKIATSTDKMKVTHEYNSAQPLNAIAVFYDVRPVEIRMWNNLSYGDILRSSQKLDIYISEAKYKSLYGSTNEDNKSEQLAEETSGDQNTLTEQPLKKEEIVFDETDRTEDEPQTIVNDITETPESTESTEANTTGQNNDEEYFEETEEVVTEVKKEDVKTTSTKKTSATGTYTVREGDNLSQIAEAHDISLSQLMEWNNLENDKIFTGQKLKVKEMKSKGSVHTVAEGENLTMIADEYGLSLSEIMKMNNLSSDKILVGQKLKVSYSGKNNSTKNSNSKKTHKVKSGETLASIAKAHGVSITDLKKWNNIKSEKILTGQVLKLYDDGKKIRRKKN